MLILTRKTDQQIKIGDDITLTIIEIHDGQVRIGVEAPRNIKVFRQEVFNAIQEENKEAIVDSNIMGKLSKLLKN